ncbi:Membrane protein involved in aromatic hydrocarbon degradation [Candidatus Magnetomorum sp. HK-1]|nr:Membrane protein involved in aromatic hydrocarbon degradation [Candidatus Magnetomorum sp. HK-1]
MNNKRLSITVICVFFFLIKAQTWAEAYSIEKTIENIDRAIENISSFSMNGSGAIPQGMGNAYIGLSEDCTGFTWNPASPIMLEKTEMALAGSFFNRIEGLNFTIDDRANGNQAVDQLSLKYFGIAYPTEIYGKYMCFSIFYHKIMDFNRKWNFTFAFDDDYRKIDYQSEGALTTIGFGACYRIKKNLAFGISINVMNDDLTKNSWEQKTYQLDTGCLPGNNSPVEFSDYYYNKTKYSLKGVNANIGLLWRNINKSQLSIGLVCKTPFHSSFEKSEIDTLFNKSTSSYTLKMPLSFGIGFSYRISDKLISAFDIYRTEWDNFVQVDSSGRKISPITGKQHHQSHISSTHQIRLGFNYNGLYKNNYIFPVCFGMFYDPSPAEGSPDNIWGLTIGAGIVNMDQFSMDFAYQYRFGNDTSFPLKYRVFIPSLSIIFPWISMLSSNNSFGIFDKRIISDG